MPGGSAGRQDVPSSVASPERWRRYLRGLPWAEEGTSACAACFALSSAGIWFAVGLNQFVVWRMIGGVGIGAASIIAPMYIAEIAPTRLRGRLVTLYQLGIVLGILAAVFSNMQIQRMGDDAWNTAVGWRWMFLMGIFPAIIFAVMILSAPESPRWLMKMGRISEGRRRTDQNQWC